MSKSFILGATALVAVLSSQVFAQKPPATPSPPPTEASPPPDAATPAAAGAAQTGGSQCVPAREDIKFAHHGQYHRIHPSGDMFLYTESNRAILVDLKDRKNPKTIRTPMREETYPVESAKGGWELMASPVGGGSRGSRGGMDYFAMKDLRGNPDGAKPAYTDPQFGQYYHSAAELPGSDDKVKKVRTVLYESRLFRDYEMEVNGDGSIGKVTKSEEKKLCENIFARPARPQSAIDENRRLMREYETKTNEYYTKWDSNEIRNRMRNSTPEERAVLEGQRSVDRTALERLRAQAEDALYGPEYVTARNAVRALREKIGEAERAYLNLAAYKEARGAIRKAEDEEFRIYQEIRQSPALTAIHNAREKLVRDYHAATTEARKREIEREHREIGVRYDEKYRQLQAESTAARTAKQNRIDAEKALRETEKSDAYVAYRKLSLEINGLESELSILRDGRRVDNPIVSKDGTHFAGLVGNRIEIFKIKDDGNCEEVGKLPFQGSKVSFSYPQEGQPLRITFTSEGGGSRGYARGVYVYNTETKETSLVSDTGDRGAYYPGFTLDGRIMFKNEAGMVIIDPLQAMKQGCIAANGAKLENKDSKTGETTR